MVTHFPPFSLQANEPYYAALAELDLLVRDNPGIIHYNFKILLKQLVFLSCMLTGRNSEAMETAREVCEFCSIATGGFKHELTDKWRQITKGFTAFVNNKTELKYMLQSWDAEL